MVKIFKRYIKKNRLRYVIEGKGYLSKLIVMLKEHSFMLNLDIIFNEEMIEDRLYIEELHRFDIIINDNIYRIECVKSDISEDYMAVYSYNKKIKDGRQENFPI